MIYREKHRLTQADLAKLLNVSPATVSHIETGRRRIDAENVLDFEERLNREVTRHQMRIDLYPIEVCPKPLPDPEQPTETDHRSPGRRCEDKVRATALEQIKTIVEQVT